MSPHHYMSLALQFAEYGRLTVSPNPMVGCVIVKNNKIVGQGYHQAAGGPHAEIIALKEAQDKAQDATLYVTLEPCCHHGRTPPCTDALIAARIKKVIIACSDPNPHVSGKGIQLLRDAGIEVEVGLCEARAKKLNEIFFHYICHQRPFVIAKWAMSLDGQTITHRDDSRVISGEEAKISTHQTRQQVDAILVGAETARMDNPELTVRLNDVSAKQPLRIILTTRGQLPLNLKLFEKNSDINWREKLIEKNIDLLILEKNKLDQIDLRSLLTELGKRQISSLLVEGGMKTHQLFFQEKLVNKIHVYLAPTIIGSLKEKEKINYEAIQMIGTDHLYIAQLGEE
jgi:diaminohydroxyphosphoribosylaminopyrimidine deaminase/5-amino-6-(5-phosphoribosylamino)uracil reductase